MQAKVADREVTAALLQDEQRKAALLAQVLRPCHEQVLGPLSFHPDTELH